MEPHRATWGRWDIPGDTWRIPGKYLGISVEGWEHTWKIVGIMPGTYTCTIPGK